MSLDIFWFLPTSGDTRYLGKSDFGRPATNDYMRQIAVTAESLGYDGLLIPTGSSCLDPWVTAASLIPVTQRIKLLVALRTSVERPDRLGAPGRDAGPGAQGPAAAQRGAGRRRDRTRR